jgi:hypothetical protein
VCVAIELRNLERPVLEGPCLGLLAVVMHVCHGTGDEVREKRLPWLDYPLRLWEVKEADLEAGQGLQSTNREPGAQTKKG